MIWILIPAIELVEHNGYVSYAKHEIIDACRLSHGGQPLCERFASPHAFIAARVLDKHGDITASSPMFAKKCGASVRAAEAVAEENDRSRRLRGRQINVQWDFAIFAGVLSLRIWWSVLALLGGAR